uniref:Cation channel sperm associated 2 n=1 Tax=Macaca nemestrina TaxID=9545 RepID=A0A2K6CFF6_MACNE
MTTYHQEGQMQLPRADAIRSRLIDTFSLIEHLQGLSQAVPRHTIRELLDPSRQKKLMLGDQHQLVRFSIKPQRVGQISHAQRLLSKLHVRCSQRPPLSLWAGWVLECILLCHSFLSWLLMICLMTYFCSPNSIFSFSPLMLLPLLFQLHKSERTPLCTFP